MRGEANDIQAQVAVAWRGVEEREEIPEFRFRIRVDNPGATPFTLVPAEFELLDAALNSLGKAATEHVPVIVEAGQSATFDLAFPVEKPFKELDLTALTLRTRLQGSRWNWSSTIHREERPSPQSSFSFGIGAVFGS